MVLLKNDGLLPLKDPKGKLAVCGPLADENLRDWYTGTFRDAVSVKAGLEKEFPECDIISDSLWDIVSIKASNGKYLSVKALLPPMRIQFPGANFLSFRTGAKTG